MAQMGQFNKRPTVQCHQIISLQVPLKDEAKRIGSKNKLNSIATTYNLSRLLSGEKSPFWILEISLFSNSLKHTEGHTQRANRTAKRTDASRWEP
eukprot:m.150790 g.150790  ORF g.150790 m.150790 type:complete len:95 (+) comp38557_c0_seq4:1007-1291(+)